MASQAEPKQFSPRRRHWGYLLPLGAIVCLAVLLPQPVRAGIGDDIASFFAWVFFGFATVVGWVLTTFVGILVQIVQYNDFVNAPAVVKGWVVVRDVTNMFFIVILLLLAFGSVFRIEDYTYKHHLSKLLLMAVLVNFSKSIAGFFIDFAQVVMLTFVNGFKDAAAGNFLTGLHIKEMYSIAEKTAEGAGQSPAGLTYLAAAALALITISIATIVVGVYIVVLTMRIVMLWILIVLSPLAYLLSAFPGNAKEWSGKWWDFFGKYVTSGPILAFFLWLSLAVMQAGNGAVGDFVEQHSVNFTDIPGATITGIGQSTVLLSFIISIAMLMGGLWITQQLGIAGGHLAGAAFSGIQKAGSKVGKGVGKGAFRAATYLPREYGKRVGYGAADLALAGLGRVPGMSGALVTRAKLRAKREYGEEKEKRYLSYMGDNDRELLIRRSMRLPALRTEKGRALSKNVREQQLKTLKSLTSPEARKLMRSGVAATDPRVLAANQQYNSQFIEQIRRDAGHNIDDTNTDIYRDQELGDKVEKFLKRNPHMIAPALTRTVTVGPGRGASLGSQRTYTINNLKNSEIADLGASAVRNQPFMNQLLDRSVQELRGREVRRLSAARQMLAAGLGNVEGFTHAGAVVHARSSFHREAFNGIHQLRGVSTQHSQLVNQAFQNWQGAAPPGSKARDPRVLEGYLSSTRFGGADVNREKLGRTRELVERYGLDHLEDSEEYKAKPDQYYSQQAYQESAHALADSQIKRPENFDLEATSGVRGTIRKSEQASKEGHELGEARVATDFEQLGLEGRRAGAVRGAAKDQLLAKLMEFLRAQGEYSAAELQQFEQAVQQASQLTLLNKGRTLGEAKHLLVHERAHAVGDTHPEAVQQLWQTVPADLKEQYRRKIREFENDPALSEDDIAHEYWAEGIANETRWHDASSNIRLTEGGRQLMAQLGGAEELVTSDKLTAAPSGLTRPPTTVEPEQVAAALASTDPTVSAADPALLSALERLTQGLEGLNTGLSTLSVFGDEAEHLNRALQAFTTASKTSGHEIVRRLKMNDETYRLSTKKLKDILNRYQVPAMAPATPEASSGEGGTASAPA